MASKQKQFGKWFPVRPGSGEQAAAAVLQGLKTLPLPAVTMDVQVKAEFRCGTGDGVGVRVRVPATFTADDPFFPALTRAVNESLFPYLEAKAV